MKTKEIRELTEKELFHRLDEINEEIFKLRFRVMSNTTDKPANITNAKKEKARILTILREREIAKKGSGKNG
ncbi:50S ribosomal protein L29 [candidate division WOR-3 bacterium]|nr:50S ribosomal protein L29 [candidate division WOR-3 bacterium]